MQIQCMSALASATLSVCNIPQHILSSPLGAQKSPRRLTSAGESVTIKAQKEVLPIDGQPRFRLLQKKQLRTSAKGRLLFCVIYVSNPPFPGFTRSQRGSTPYRYIIRKCRMPQGIFRLFIFGFFRFNF